MRKKKIRQVKKKTQRSKPKAVSIDDKIKEYEEKLAPLQNLGRKSKAEKKLSVKYTGAGKFDVFQTAGFRIYCLGEIDSKKEVFTFDRSVPAHLLPAGKQWINLRK